MIMHIDVSFTPESLTQKKIEKRQIVAIDTLRASATIVTALANGARAIIPVAEPSEAVEIRAKLGGDHVLLGGERDCVKIENFDLGNSPLEYASEIVNDMTIVMCSTNGTKLYTMFRYNGPVWVGSFLNLSSVSHAVVTDGADLILACAGNNGDFSIEDTLCAGAIIDRLADSGINQINLTDSARMALLSYTANREHLTGAISEGEHGRLLTKLGFSGDIEFIAKIDNFEIAPVLKDGQIAIETEIESSTSRTIIQSNL